MIKAIIFDLDGVLVNSKDVHYHAMNSALKKIVGWEIAREEHLSSYDGLSTTAKLQKLTKEKGLDPNLYDDIWAQKQEDTFEHLKNLKTYSHIVGALKELSKKYTIIVCSNSIEKTTKLSLFYTGYLEWVDKYYSNESIKRPKPAPDIYIKAILDQDLSPANCLIIEDSPIGRRAAFDSGAHVLQVSGTDEVNLDNINNRIKQIENKQIRPKWINKNMNIVIPMAGLGSRFSEAGYTFPKPLIDVRGKTMIQVVVDNLNIDGRFIFIVQKEHYEKYNLAHLLGAISPRCEIVVINGQTEGAACTVLRAKEFINNNNPTLVANSDQFVTCDLNSFLYSSQEVDGSVLTFYSGHPKWSYAKTDDNGFISEVAEKRVISDQATVGIYYWNKGSDLVWSIEEMIRNNDRTNGEFYLFPALKYLINQGKKFKTFNIKPEEMYGLGTPEDLERFLKEYDGPI